MAKAERRERINSPTIAADFAKERRKARTRRWVSGGLRDIGIGTLFIIGAGIAVGVGAPLVGLAGLIAGTVVGAYGVGKTLAGSGFYNMARA